MNRDEKTRKGIESEKYSMSSKTLTCIIPPTKYKRTQMTSVETSSTISTHNLSTFRMPQQCSKYGLSSLQKTFEIENFRQKRNI